jgi:hypothetical protein
MNIETSVSNINSALLIPIRLYTFQDVAEICHVPLATVRYWRSMRKLPVVKIGRKALVEHKDLLSLIEKFKQPAI